MPLNKSIVKLCEYRFSGVQNVFYFYIVSRTEMQTKIRTETVYYLVSRTFYIDTVSLGIYNEGLRDNRLIFRLP